MPLNYVFVCRHGQSRSPRAAAEAERLAQENGIELTTDNFDAGGALTNEEYAMQHWTKMRGAF